MRHVLISTLPAILCCALGAACGNSESEASDNTGGTDAGRTSGMGGRPVMDASAHDGGAGGAGGGVTIRVLTVAGIDVYGWHSYRAGWSVLTDVTKVDARCSAKFVGSNCFLVDCRTSKYGMVPIPVPEMTLGNVTFTSGASKLVVEQPWQDAFGTNTTDGWQPGETIVIETAGGSVEPFTVSLPFPEPPEMLEPALGTVPNLETVLDVTKPVVVKWKPTDAQMEVQIYQAEKETPLGYDGVAAECTFDGTAGEGTFPLEVLEGYFDSDPTHLKYYTGMWAFSAHFKNKTEGGYPVQVWAGNFVDKRVTIN